MRHAYTNSSSAKPSHWWVQRNKPLLGKCLFLVRTRWWEYPIKQGDIYGTSDTLKYLAPVDDLTIEEAEAFNIMLGGSPFRMEDHAEYRLATVDITT